MKFFLLTMLQQTCNRYSRARSWPLKLDDAVLLGLSFASMLPALYSCVRVSLNHEVIRPRQPGA